MGPNIIKERINQLEQNYRSFVLSTEPSNIANAFSKKHNFSDETSIIFENGIAMLLMFFISKDDFVNYLISDCNIKDRHEAEILATGVMMALPENIRLTLEKTSSVIFENQVISEEALDINKEIKEAEAIIGALEPIRTMSGDKEATKENVYSSTQSSILTRLTGSNQTKSSDTPKWGSE